MSEITFPPAVHRFVTATNAHDADAPLAVFAPHATVVDDGTTYAEAALREWIEVHQIEPRIVITPISFAEGRLVGWVDGEFPGGPLGFAFTFTLEGDTVSRLVIVPV